MKIFSIDGASGGSGWGVAKVGSVTVAANSSVTVSIVDLGIASVDDYIVLFYGDNIKSPAYTNNVGLILIRNKTTQSFDLFCPDGPTSVPVDYAVIAKGYGGGGGGN